MTSADAGTGLDGLAQRLRGEDATAVRTLVDVFGGGLFEVACWEGRTAREARDAVVAAGVRIWGDRGRAPRRDADLVGFALARLFRELDADGPGPTAALRAHRLVAWAGLPARQVALALGVTERRVPVLVEQARPGDRPRVPDPPADLGDAVDLAVGEAPDTPPEAVRTRPRRLLLVAGLLVVVLVVALVWRATRTGQRPASQTPSPTATPGGEEVSADPRLGPDCLAKAVGATHAKLLDPDAVLLSDAGGRQWLCTTGATGLQLSGPVRQDRYGTSVLALSVRLAPDDTLAVVAGRAGAAGEPQVTPGQDNEVQVHQGQWWMVRHYTDKELAAAPSALFVDWPSFDAGAGDDLPIQRLVTWPGTDERGAGSASAQQVECLALAADQHPAAKAFSGPRAAGVLLVDSTWSGVCTYAAGDDVVSDGGVTDVQSGMASDAGVEEERNVQQLAIGGTVPKGTTSITVQTPHGELPARLVGSHWIWDDLVPNRELPLWPRKLFVTYHGGRTDDWLLPLQIDLRAVEPLPDIAVDDEYAPGQGRLTSLCSSAKAVVATSDAGHLAAAADGTGCVVLDGATRRFGSSGVLGSGTLALHRVGGGGTGLTLLVGSGTAKNLPNGATLVFHTAAGDVPATLMGTVWLIEAAVPASSASPVSGATLVVNGRTTQVPVTLG